LEIDCLFLLLNIAFWAIIALNTIHAISGKSKGQGEKGDLISCLTREVVKVLSIVFSSKSMAT
jgi:hypothetical protein